MQMYERAYKYMSVHTCSHILSCSVHELLINIVLYKHNTPLPFSKTIYKAGAR